MAYAKTNVWNSHPRADQVEAPDPRGEALEIFGYTNRVAYRTGDSVRLFVHTTAPTYSITVIRDDASGTVAYSKTGLKGIRQVTPREAAAATQGCDWTDPVEIQLDPTWQAGPYVVVLRAEASGAAVEREAFFVVRGASADRSKRLAMVLTTSTWTAYNDWGGANSYRSMLDGRSVDVPAPILSIRRPWARGFVRLAENAPRHADVPDLPRGSPPNYPCLDWALENGWSRHYCDAGWAYYERPFYHWALRNGYDVDLLTQNELHDEPGCLDGYAAALLVGHDEYWTWEMRDTVDAYVTRGGRLARFAGNMIWQVRKNVELGTQTCYKIADDDPFVSERPSRVTTHWDSTLIRRPAALTFGLTGVAGAYNRFGACSPRATGGLTVYRPDHWSLKGTDLYYGDMFGAGQSRIACFEVDGVDYGFKWGQPFATGSDGAPSNLEIVAMTPASSGEHDRHGGGLNAPLAEVLSLIGAVPPINARPEGHREYGAATMASFATGKGEVFNAGCCEWVTGLIRADFVVEQITRNVLDRFLDVPTASASIA